MEYLLGIDAGTNGMKATLFDSRGNDLATTRIEYTLYTPEPDIVELDPEAYWNALTYTILEILKISKINPKNIGGLAISSQGETIIPIDKEGKPLRRAIVWLDNRAKNESKIIKNHFNIDTIFKITGQPEVVPTWPAAKILWIKRNEPELFKKVYKYLLLEDFLLFKLTGLFVTDYSLVSSTLMFDISKEKWWEEMLEFIGIDEDQLPILMKSGKAVSNIAPHVADKIGLSSRTIVSTGALDQAAGALGAGNIRPGIISETTGTVLAIIATTEQPVYDIKHRIPCHHHALPKKFFLIPWCPTAGMILRWFRDNFGQHEIERAKKMGLDPYDLLIEAASKINAGSDKLIMLPHFMGAGSPEFDPYAKGVIFGLTLSHTKAHITRAILESVGFMLKRNLELLEELGIQVNEIVSLGGASRSPLWNQIKADITSKRIITLRTKEAACLGVAILAGVAINQFKSIEEGCMRMVQKGEKYEPKHENQEVYQKLYTVYSKLYECLEELFPLLS